MHPEQITLPAWLPEDLSSIINEHANKELLTKHPLLETVHDLEDCCTALLGHCPLNLNNYAEVYKGIRDKAGTIEGILRELPNFLNRAGLSHLSNMLGSIQAHSLCDSDLLTLTYIVTPIIREKLGGETLRLSLMRHLVRMAHYPVITSTVVGFESTLAYRVCLEIKLAQKLMTLLDFEWPSAVASFHVIGESDSDFQWSLDPQIFAGESLSFIGMEEEAATLIVRQLGDYDSSNSFVVEKGNRKQSQEEALQSVLENYLASSTFAKAKKTKTPFTKLPTAYWNQSQTILTVDGKVEIDLSSPGKLGTLLQVRKALQLTSAKKTRVFDLDKVQTAIKEEGATLKNGNPLTFGTELARFKNDAFRGKTDKLKFDALFQRGDRGVLGQYMVNVRLRSEKK